MLLTIDDQNKKVIILCLDLTLTDQKLRHQPW